VKKGAHPEGVDLSALEHVLDGRPVIDPARGLFLAATHRLHEDVNAFTSEVFYAGQLRSAPEANLQSVSAPGALSGTGVRWLPVVHEGNRNSSEEEARLVAELYEHVLRGSWTDQHNATTPLGPAQVLVVAPYNAQVELLTSTLAESLRRLNVEGEPRVGTVDRIQGQQAALVMYSMATSSPEEMPRNMEFLYSLNRLNVATSRGRCIASIVASPALLTVRVHTPVQMKLANALCRFVEVAADQARLPVQERLPLGA
jgi:superfamily I DNA and/or RNA helicase